MRLIAILTLVLLGCVEVGPRLYTDEGEPIVGRLQTRDAVYDLTASSVIDNPNLPREAVAIELTADIHHERKVEERGSVSEPSNDRR